MELVLTPPVSLVLDRPRTLRFDKRALFQAEQEMARVWGTPRNILVVLGNANRMTMTDMSILLWLGLRHEDPTLTLEATQELMSDMAVVPAIFSAVLEAWNLATQTAVPPGNGAAPADPLPVSPGASSGPSPVLS